MKDKMIDEHQRILRVYQKYQLQANSRFFGYKNLAHIYSHHERFR